MSALRVLRHTAIYTLQQNYLQIFVYQKPRNLSHDIRDDFSMTKQLCPANYIALLDIIEHQVETQVLPARAMLFRSR